MAGEEKGTRTILSVDALSLSTQCSFQCNGDSNVFTPGELLSAAALPMLLFCSPVSG